MFVCLFAYSICVGCGGSVVFHIAVPFNFTYLPGSAHIVPLSGGVANQPGLARKPASQKRCHQKCGNDLLSSKESSLVNAQMFRGRRRLKLTIIAIRNFVSVSTYLAVSVTRCRVNAIKKLGPALGLLKVSKVNIVS